MSQETTLVNVIEILRQRGYTEDFNIIGNEIRYKNGEKVLAHDLIIDDIYRFEGDGTDVDDEAILYAISCRTHGRKGILVNGYGTTSDPKTEEIIKLIEKSDK